MGNLESNLNNLSETFDKLNEIRESSLTISRSIVRDCSKSIRYLHRNDTEGAKEFIKKTEEETGLPVSDVIRYGGDKIFKQLL